MGRRRTSVSGLIPGIPAAVVGLLAVAVWVALASTGGAPADLDPLPYPQLGIPSGGPGDQYTYVWAPGALEAARMYLPSEAMIYRVVRTVPTKEAALDLAERLGVRVSAEDRARLPAEAPEAVWGARCYSCSLESTNVEDQTRFDCKDVELWDSGCFRYLHRGQMPFAAPNSTAWAKEALSEERTRQIVEEFLAQSGLLPEGSPFVEVQAAVAANAPAMSIHHDGGAPRILARQVVYARRPDGIELGAFRAAVNGAGVIYQVSNDVPNVSPVARYPLLSPEEARRMLRPGMMPSHFHGPATAAIESATLYYTEPLGEQDILQPIYWFKGTARTETGGAEEFQVRWPAVRPEYLAE